jgi:hypothetical protein
LPVAAAEEAELTQQRQEPAAQAASRAAERAEEARPLPAVQPVPVALAALVS